jgi:hypothetical protein
MSKMQHPDCSLAPDLESKQADLAHKCRCAGKTSNVVDVVRVCKSSRFACIKPASIAVPVVSEVEERGMHSAVPSLCQRITNEKLPE